MTLRRSEPYISLSGFFGVLSKAGISTLQLARRIYENPYTYHKVEKMGDDNTSFFHAMTTVRYRRKKCF
jgi:hypothetical protein